MRSEWMAAGRQPNRSEVHVPRPAHKEMKTLTAEQLDRLFEVTYGDRWHALWVLLGTRGLRIGEAMGLQWTDIDFTARSLVIQRALQRHRGAGLWFVDPKSATSRRTVTLGGTACATLREHRARQYKEWSLPRRAKARRQSEPFRKP